VSFRNNAFAVGAAGLLITTAGLTAGLYFRHPAPDVITRQAAPAPARTVIRWKTTSSTTPTATASTGPIASPAPVPHVNGATWSVTVVCAVSQCTSLPGAGPAGSTCGAVVDGEQVCVG
jgi:hypothetical protein